MNIIRRREFLALAGASAAALPMPALVRAQQLSPGMKRLGFMIALTADDPFLAKLLEALRQGLASQGWVEGKNLVIDYRFASSALADARRNAQQLIDLKPDVLVSVSPNNATALADATKTIPIVFAQVIDTLGTQIIGNLAHPTGNATGFFNAYDTTISGKWIELLKELRPDLERAGLFYDASQPNGPGFRSAFEAGAKRSNVVPVILDDRSFSDIAGTLADFAKQPKGGVVIPGDPTSFPVRQQLYLVAASNRLPVVWGHILFAIDGAPVVYTIDTLTQVQGGGEYAGRVLNGEKIANLPAQLPRMYSLIINIKGAKAQGLTIPTSLIIRADQVIE